MRYLIVILLAVLIIASFGLVSCVYYPTPTPSPPPGPPAAPEIKLDHIEVAHYESLADDYPKGYDAKRVGFFELGIVLDITNPNDYAIRLEDLRCTLDFEGGPGKWFGVGAGAAYEYQWIPAKTTNQARLNSLFTTRTFLLSLLVPGVHGAMLKELGMSPHDMIKKWFAELPDFKFKIRVNGEAKFTSPYGDVRATFSGIFPK